MGRTRNEYEDDENSEAGKEKRLIIGDFPFGMVSLPTRILLFSSLLVLTKYGKLICIKSGLGAILN